MLTAESVLIPFPTQAALEFDLTAQKADALGKQLREIYGAITVT
jgi:hypothetical protein